MLLATETRPIATTATNLADELRRLMTWQGLLDLLLQVKPQAENMRKVGLVFEAMICVVTEVFDLYGQIRRGISRAVARVYDDDEASSSSSGKVEASLAIGILRKATVQIDELSLFLELCREMGVLTASFCPKAEDIHAEQDLLGLERIINGVSRRELRLDHRDGDHGRDGAIVTFDHHEENKECYSSKTIITDKWEIFDEDHHYPIRVMEKENEVITSNHVLMMLPPPPPPPIVLPDLITF